MSLSVGVGVLADLLQNDEEGAEWFRESLAKVNSVLAEENLQTHSEPEDMPRLDSRSVFRGFPYSYLHYLRRAYARWKQNPYALITPCAVGEDPSSDPAIDEESCMFDSHLLCHSDCSGFYIPIRFSEVLVDQKDQLRIEGGLLGSSYKLAEELTAMAPSLGIQLVAGRLHDDAADSIRASIQAESELWIERGVWLTLFEAARLSIQHNTAIHFG